MLITESNLRAIIAEEYAKLAEAEVADIGFSRILRFSEMIGKLWSTKYIEFQNNRTNIKSQKPSRKTTDNVTQLKTSEIDVNAELKKLKNTFLEEIKRTLVQEMDKLGEKTSNYMSQEIGYYIRRKLQTPEQYEEKISQAFKKGWMSVANPKGVDLIDNYLSYFLRIITSEKDFRERIPYTSIKKEPTEPPSSPTPEPKKRPTHLSVVKEKNSRRI